MPSVRANLLALAFSLTVGLTASGTRAATYRVDDSSSLPQEPTAELRWREAVPSRKGDDTLEGSIGVMLRLNVGPWMNRVGRLYLVLPEQPAPLVSLSWRTQGRLLPGQARPGQRALVYEGPLSTPWIEERFDFGIEARGSRFDGMQPLNVYFEFHVDLTHGQIENISPCAPRGPRTALHAARPRTVRRCSHSAALRALAQAGRPDASSHRNHERGRRGVHVSRAHRRLDTRRRRRRLVLRRASI